MEMFDDMSRPIKFDIEKNDDQFALVLGLDSNDDTKWVFVLEDFYNYYFDTLDTTQFSAEPQKFSFGGPLILDTLSESE